MNESNCFYCEKSFPNYVMHREQIYSYLLGADDWVMDEILVCPYCEQANKESHDQRPDDIPDEMD